MFRVVSFAFREDDPMTRSCRTTLMPLAAAALCAAVVGCADNGRPATVGGRGKDPRSMKPVELQQFVSTNAALAGANAGATLTQLPTEPLPPPIPAVPPVPAFPPPPPSGRTVVIATAMSVPETFRRVSPPAVKIEKVTSDKYHETEHDAQYDALGVAARKIAEKLGTLEPPIDATVSRNRVLNEYVSHASAKVLPLTDLERDALTDSKVSKNSVRYQFDVEISEQQLRNLRGEGRTKHLAPFALAGLALCLGLSVLLKLTGAAAAAVRRV
jgi:hypothetical protein